MKRKIIKLGQSTYVASLPSAWIRENKLERGDYVELDEEGGALRLSIGGIRKGKKLHLDIQEMNDKLVHGYLEVAYSLGAESIELIHKPHIKVYSPHLRAGKDLRTTELLQQIVNTKFINMEIVEQSDKRTVIKDLGAGITEESAQNIYNRILFLISQQAKDTLEGLQNKDVEKLKSILPSFENTRKFILFYSRLLSCVPFKKEEAKIRTNLLHDLNYLNSAIKATINHTLGVGEVKYSKEAIAIFAHMVKHVEEMVSLCLNFNHEKAMQFLNDREQIWDARSKNPGTKDDLFLYWNLGALMGSTWYVVRELYGLHLEMG